LAPGVATWLYVNTLDAEETESLSDSPSVPDAKESPEATDTQASGVASTHDSLATESARSEGIETSSHAASTWGSVGSSVDAFAERSWWDPPEPNDDFLYKESCEITVPST
jgi:hypothetical protein